jgi:hypothetical protein
VQFDRTPNTASGSRLIYTELGSTPLPTRHTVFAGKAIICCWPEGLAADSKFLRSRNFWRRESVWKQWAPCRSGKQRQLAANGAVLALAGRLTKALRGLTGI